MPLHPVPTLPSPRIISETCIWETYSLMRSFCASTCSTVLLALTLLFGQTRTSRPWMSTPFLASLPSLPDLVSHIRNSHPFLSCFLPPFCCHCPAQPILKIEDLNLVVALRRVRKVEKLFILGASIIFPREFAKGSSRSPSHTSSTVGCLFSMKVIREMAIMQNCRS